MAGQKSNIRKTLKQAELAEERNKKRAYAAQAEYDEMKKRFYQAEDNYRIAYRDWVDACEKRELAMALHNRIRDRTVQLERRKDRWWNRAKSQFLRAEKLKAQLKGRIH